MSDALAVTAGHSYGRGIMAMGVSNRPIDLISVRGSAECVVLYHYAGH